MADQEAAATKKGGWLKTILGAMGGMLSGAVAMYLTPLVDKAVHPALPVANFSVEINPENLIVHFQNLSQAGQGWWDFGDGSPLEPVLPDVSSVSHTYKQAGEYTAKMSLHNILGEENIRTVPVRLDPPLTNQPLRILALEVEPIGKGSYAPATFHLRGQVQGAQMLVWDLGDEHDLEVTDPAEGTDKIVKFLKPGGYVVKLAAFNGKLHDQKTEVITVMEPPSDTVTAILTTKDQGSRVQTRTEPVTFAIHFPLDHDDSVLPIDGKAMARQGFTIKEVHLHGPNANEVLLTKEGAAPLDAEALGVRNTRNLALALTENRRAVVLSGELIRPATAGRNPEEQPSLMLKAQIVQQRELPAESQEVPVTTTLALPASGVLSSGLLQMPPLPAGWVKTERKVSLEVREGTQLIWQDETPLPHRVVLTLHKRRCLLTATQVNDQVHIDLREDSSSEPQPAPPK
jgi:PKD repeat protein